MLSPSCFLLHAFQVITQLTSAPLPRERCFECLFDPGQLSRASRRLQRLPPRPRAAWRLEPPSLDSSRANNPNLTPHFSPRDHHWGYWQHASSRASCASCVSCIPRRDDQVLPRRHCLQRVSSRAAALAALPWGELVISHFPGRGTGPLPLTPHPLVEPSVPADPATAPQAPHGPCPCCPSPAQGHLPVWAKL